MLSRADLVLCVSEPLAEAPGARMDDVHVVPNGCDFDAHRLPMWTGRRPRIGLSDVAPRVDVELLVALAEATRTGTSKLSDRCRRSFRSTAPGRLEICCGLERFPTSRFPPPSRDSMSGSCRCGRFPFATDCSPIQVFDYLAAGKPVVSSPVAQLERLARTREDRARAPSVCSGRLGRARGRFPRSHVRRRAFAAANSWDARVDKSSACSARLAPFHRTSRRDRDGRAALRSAVSAPRCREARGRPDARGPGSAARRVVAITCGWTGIARRRPGARCGVPWRPASCSSMPTSSAATRGHASDGPARRRLLRRGFGRRGSRLYCRAAAAVRQCPVVASAVGWSPDKPAVAADHGRRNPGGCAAVTAVSDAVAAELAKPGLVRRPTIIRNGVPMRAQRQSPLVHRNHWRCRHLIERKGVDVLLEAVSLLPVGAFSRLRIAGTGESARGLETLAAGLSLPARWTGVGTSRPTILPDHRRARRTITRRTRCR